MHRDRLRIFLRNADFLEQLSQGSVKQDPQLQNLDKWLVSLFIVGAVGALLAGALAANSKYHDQHDTSNQPTEMTQVKPRSEEGIVPPLNANTGADRSTPAAVTSAPQPLHESMNGFEKLRASGDVEKRSIDGLQRLQPQANVAPVPATPPTAAHVPEPTHTSQQAKP